MLPMTNALLAPPSPLRNPHTLQGAPATLPSPGLHDTEPDKVPTLPVTAVSTKHVQILVLKRALSLLEEPVNLAIVVQEIQPLLRELFAAEVVCLELDGAGESRDWGRRGNSAGGAVGGGRGREDGPEGGGEGVEEGGGCGWDVGCAEGGSVVDVDCGVEAVGDGVGLVHDVVDVVGGHAPVGADLSGDTGVLVGAIGAGFVAASSGQ